jgi:nucleoside triphosphate pyrophosphatase
MRFVLASASPRRRALLDEAGLAFDVYPVDVDESPRPGEAAAAYVARLAEEKARRAANALPGRPVLGADTVVVIDGELLGKPADNAEAAAMLRRLSGRAHEVLTGVVVVFGEQVASVVETTAVRFRDIAEDEIAWYVASGEPADKAGAYAIQGLASRFVAQIEGSYSNVVGLPVAAVLQILRKMDLPPAGSGAG